MADKDNDMVSKAEYNKRLRQVDGLMLCMANTRDKLRVVLRAMEEITCGDAVGGMDDDDRSILFGAVGILEEIAESCDKVYNSATE